VSASDTVAAGTPGLRLDDLSVVSNLSDHITVLARGQVLAQGDYRSVSTNPAVVEAYLGTAHGQPASA
jgi:branched-chain amino acid transport system ATP-binding protein